MIVMVRDRWLAAQGFHVLRFWNTEIFDNPAGVAARVAESGAAMEELAR